MAKGQTNSFFRIMKYRITFFSALVFPGSGQILYGDRKKGMLLIFCTLVPMMALLYSLYHSILAYIPPMNQYPQTLPEIFQLSLAIKNKVYHQEVFKFTLVSVLLVLVWLYGIWDAYLEDRKNLSSHNNETKFKA